jgi:hypothetical protein
MTPNALRRATNPVPDATGGSEQRQTPCAERKKMASGLARGHRWRSTRPKVHIRNFLYPELIGPVLCFCQSVLMERSAMGAGRETSGRSAFATQATGRPGHQRSFRDTRRRGRQKSKFADDGPLSPISETLPGPQIDTVRNKSDRAIRQQHLNAADVRTS